MLRVQSIVFVVVILFVLFIVSFFFYTPVHLILVVQTRAAVLLAPCDTLFCPLFTFCTAFQLKSSIPLHREEVTTHSKKKHGAVMRVGDDLLLSWLTRYKVYLHFTSKVKLVFDLCVWLVIEGCVWMCKNEISICFKVYM